MPAPAMGRGWSQAALGVTAAGEWLRNLLCRTTHSEGDAAGMEFEGWPQPR